MKKLWILTLTILLASAMFPACTISSGESSSVKPDSGKNDETEKVEKKDKKEKLEKVVVKSDEEKIEDDKETTPDPKSNALSGSERPTGEPDSVSNAIGKQKTAAKKNDWLYVYDGKRGYGFYVPDGTTGDWGKVQNIDTFAGYTPDKIGIYVFAWKDRTATRETLLENARQILEGMGETVTAGKVVGASNNYALTEATSVDAQGVKSKMKVLVGTDVTDKYVMIVGCDEKDYNQKKDTIEQIWGSFEMWSGRGKR